MTTDLDDLVERALLEAPAPRSVNWIIEHAARRRRTRRRVGIALVGLPTVALLAAVVISMSSPRPKEIITVSPTAVATSSERRQVVIPDVGTTSFGSPSGTSGPQDYVTTESSLRRWPRVTQSDSRTTSGFGFSDCDDGVFTKYASATSPTDLLAVAGTLCAFISLSEPMADATVACATASEGTHYARCRRSIDTPEVAEDPSRSTTRDATEAEADAADGFLVTSRSSGPPSLGSGVGAATPEGAVVLADGDAQVELSTGTADQPVCFRIEVPVGSASGCIGRPTLESGLGYLAMLDGAGEADVFGIVPDGITTVDIGGTRLQVEDNVWHAHLPAGTRAAFTVRSPEGASASAD